MICSVVDVRGAVLASVKGATVIDWIERTSEGVARVEIDRSAVTVIRIVQIGYSVVVIVPINVVFKAVPIDVRIDRVWTVVTVECPVDCVKVCIVIEITVPVDVKNVDDPVAVVINIVPVCNSIVIPVVKLRERGTSRGAPWIWIGWVRCSHCRAVPCGNFRGFVKWE